MLIGRQEQPRQRAGWWKEVRARATGRVLRKGEWMEQRSRKTRQHLLGILEVSHLEPGLNLHYKVTATCRQVGASCRGEKEVEVSIHAGAIHLS